MADKRTTLPADSAARKEIPIARGCDDYFPAALAAVAHRSYIANRKHNPGEPMHHARGKSNDHRDCLRRHDIDLAGSPDGYETVEWIDPETGKVESARLPIVSAIAWRALALCQEWLEANEGAPLAPGARLPEGGMLVPKDLTQPLIDLLKNSTVGSAVVRRGSIDDATPAEWNRAARRGISAQHVGRSRPTCIADTSCSGCESCAPDANGAGNFAGWPDKDVRCQVCGGSGCPVCR